MIDASSYLVYVLASTALILVPGPAQALVLAQTLSRGSKAGALTAVGLNLGTLLHTAAAALGISAILATSALAFTLVKYVGAAYLIFLGVKALLARAPTPSPDAPTATSVGSPLLQGLAAGVLNPKVAIFFLAFLPQFVEPARGSVMLQFLLLGATMAVLDVLYEIMLVYAFSRLRERYLAHRWLAKWQARISGLVFIALGVRLAAQGR